MDDQIKKSSGTSETFSLSLTCPICLQGFNFNGGLHSMSALPCGHIFGKSCLTEWFTTTSNKGICPVCRTSIAYMKNKICESDSNTDFIIDLHGCSNNGFIQGIIQDPEDLVQEYKEKIKKSSLDIARLRTKMRSDQKILRSVLLSLVESRNKSRNNNGNRSIDQGGNGISNVNNGSSNESEAEIIIRRAAVYLKSEREFNSITSAHILGRLIERSPSCNNIKFNATQKYSYDFEEVTDASCYNDVGVIAIKKSEDGNVFKNYGVMILNGETSATYIPLSDEKVIAVKIAVDPSLTTKSKMVAVCEKGKFYEIIYDKDTNSIVSYFESLIDSFLNELFLYKPSSLVWLSKDKYIIGTETGELFVRNFGINVSKNINYIEGTSNDNNTILCGPVKMLNKINENTVICYQSKKLCIYNDKCGRIIIKNVGDKVVSMHFNQHSKKLVLLDEDSNETTALELYKIFINSPNNNDINNFAFKCIHRELMCSYGKKSVEVPFISMNHQGNQLDFIFRTMQNDEAITLLCINSVDHKMNSISINLNLLSKVCLEEGKYRITSTDNVKFLIISKNNVKLFELKEVSN
uniref:RING-type domain-containing protein n=1 Tax=Parastrongyloides trichosuri TaxID=131310 RepID=A0A0N5A0P4_PARTI